MKGQFYSLVNYTIYLKCLQLSPFLFKNSCFSLLTHLQLPPCINMLCIKLLPLAYTCNTSVYKTQLMWVALIFLYYSLHGLMQVQMDVMMRWLVVQMTDEYEVHGPFILTDLLEDTSIVSYQAVIGWPYQSEGCHEAAWILMNPHAKTES